jgi:hypothetical protein
MSAKTNQELVVSFLVSIRADIVKDQYLKGIRASGKSAASMDIFTNPEGGKLVGSAYIRQQIFGREPGKFPPVADILDWVKRKARQLVNITQESLAFLIARKIARRGTDIYQRKRQGLAFDEIIATNQEEFERHLRDVKRIEYKTSILNALSNAARALNILILITLWA